MGLLSARFSAMRKKIGGRRRKYPARRRGMAARGRFARPTGVVWIKKKLVSSPTASGTSNSMIFRLTDLPDGATYAKLYDSYKITGVKVQILPQETVNQLNTGGSGNYVVPTIAWSANYDDNSTGWSETDLLQRSNCKTTIFNKSVSEYVRVKPLIQSADGHKFQLPFRKSFWLSTNDDDGNVDSTPHYGLDYIVSNGGASSQQTYFRTVTTYYISFKTPRSTKV